MEKARLLAMLTDAGLERIRDEIERLMQPSIRLWLSPFERISLEEAEFGRRTVFWRDGFAAGMIRMDAWNSLEPDADVAIGRSKIGGQPDLPPDFDWPYWNNRPLHFLAQFNMAEVAPYDVEHALPASGMLYFFLDDTMETLSILACNNWQGERGWKVIYYAGDMSVLQRTPTPPGLPELFGELHPCAIQFEPEMTVPDDDSIEFDLLTERLALTEEEKETYWNFLIQMYDTEAQEKFGSDFPKDGNVPRHRLLGCSDVMYEDGRLTATMLEEEIREYPPWEDQEAHRKFWLGRAERSQAWRLLFQIDTDASADMDWGDAGTMYFFIRHDDLQTGNFDNVWLEYEGH